MTDKPLLPHQDPRNQQAPLSVGSFLITAIGVVGSLVVALQALLDANLFPPDSGAQRALVIAAAVFGAVLLGLRYLSERLRLEQKVASDAARIVRAEAKAKNPGLDDLERKLAALGIERPKKEGGA